MDGTGGELDADAVGEPGTEGPDEQDEPPGAEEPAGAEEVGQAATEQQQATERDSLGPLVVDTPEG